MPKRERSAYTYVSLYMHTTFTYTHTLEPRYLYTLQMHTEALLLPPEALSTEPPTLRHAFLATVASWRTQEPQPMVFA